MAKILGKNLSTVSTDYYNNKTDNSFKNKKRICLLVMFRSDVEVKLTFMHYNLICKAINAFYAPEDLRFVLFRVILQFNTDKTREYKCH